jgi:hypothetical protein
MLRTSPQQSEAAFHFPTPDLVHLRKLPNLLCNLIVPLRTEVLCKERELRKHNIHFFPLSVSSKVPG